MSIELNTDLFHYERLFHSRDSHSIAGMDEAGRGPLAGPVVAACVLFPPAWYYQGIPDPLKTINDSKKLTEKKRTHLYEQLLQTPGIHYGIAQVDAPEIDSINILHATYRAMNLALAQLPIELDFVLVDGLPVPTLSTPHHAIVKGDSQSYSIAAASIMAKVFRDRLMVHYDTQYPQYGFATHKGYGTAQHLKAIEQHGTCPIHRLTFNPCHLYSSKKA